MPKSTVVKVIAVVLAIGVIIAFLYKRETGYVSQIEEMQKTNAEALEKINKVREQEKAQTEATIKSYETAMKDISSKYAKALTDLETEKKKRKEQILQDRDPKVLAQKLAESLNFKVTQ